MQWLISPLISHSGPAADLPQPTVSRHAAEPMATAMEKTKATPMNITKEAVAALSQHFVTTSWPLNKTLPRSKLNKELAVIQLNYRVLELQVDQQLKKYNGKKYCPREVILSQLSEKIKVVVRWMIF